MWLFWGLLNLPQQTHPKTEPKWRHFKLRKRYRYNKEYPTMAINICHIFILARHFQNVQSLKITASSQSLTQKDNISGLAMKHRIGSEFS